jgi:hypothetical protein
MIGYFSGKYSYPIFMLNYHDDNDDNSRFLLNLCNNDTSVAF